MSVDYRAYVRIESLHTCSVTGGLRHGVTQRTFSDRH